MPAKLEANVEPLPEDIVLRGVEYKIVFLEDASRVRITCRLSIESSISRTMIGCLFVDGHELLPSARIALKSGQNSIMLRAVSIVNPGLWWTHGEGSQALYKMELVLASGPKNAVLLAQDIGVRHLCWRKGIELNGKLLALKPAVLVLPEEAPQAEKISALVVAARESGIRLLLPLSGNVSAALLAACDREGMILTQALVRKERGACGRLRGHPSVLFLRRARACVETQLPAINPSPGVYALPDLSPESLLKGELASLLTGKTPDLPLLV